LFEFPNSHCTFLYWLLQWEHSLLLGPTLFYWQHSHCWGAFTNSHGQCMRIIPLHLGFSYTFLLLKMYQLSCCLTDHIMRVNNLRCWKNYDTANQYYFSPHAGRSLQFYHVYFPLGKQISSCHSDLVTASLPPGRVNCLISFPPLLLCHWFSNSASQCVKCSFFLQRKPFFQKWFFKRSVLFLKTETLNVCLQQCSSNSGDLC
jgi:hypothetical protein